MSRPPTPAQRLCQAMDGCSIEAVANASRLNRRTIQRWRNKISSAPALARLSDALGISLDWLLAGRGPQWLPGRGPQDLIKLEPGHPWQCSHGRRIERAPMLDEECDQT